MKKNIIPIYDYYDLLMSKESINSFQLTYESYLQNKANFTKITKKLSEHDSHLDFKNFYKQFSVEDDNQQNNNQNNGEQQKSGNEGGGGNNKEGDKNKKPEDKKKVLDTIKNKIKGFHKKIMDYIRKIAIEIVSKNLKKKLEGLKETYEKGTELTKLKENFKPAGQLVVLNISLWLFKIWRDLIFRSVEVYNTSKEPSELGSSATILKEYSDEFTKNISRSIKSLSAKKEYDGFEAEFKVVQQKIKVLVSKGGDEKTLGESAALIKDCDTFLNGQLELARNYGENSRYVEPIKKILDESGEKTIIPGKEDIFKELETKVGPVVNSNDSDEAKVKLSTNISTATNPLANIIIYILEYGSGFIVETQKTIKDKNKEENKKNKEEIKNNKNNGENKPNVPSSN